MLVLACTLAPALPAREAPAKAMEKKCGCDRACCATDRECAPPAPTPVRTAAPATLANVELRTVAKPAKRIAVLAFLKTVSLSLNGFSPTPARAAAPARIVPADSVALFQAHCSFLI
jgi:hypothetical protein